MFCFWMVTKRKSLKEKKNQVFSLFNVIEWKEYKGKRSGKIAFTEVAYETRKFKQHNGIA